MIRPFSRTEFLSTPTFSPTTIGIPKSAAHTANEFQYLAAMKVDPSAPVIKGILHFVLISSMFRSLP